VRKTDFFGISGPERTKFGPIGVKHMGTFALREAPTGGLEVSIYRADRWTPISRLDKAIIAELPQVRYDWMEAEGGVWFGFEPEEAVIEKIPVVKYYNLVILRPMFVDKFDAVRIASAAVFGEEWRNGSG